MDVPEVSGAAVVVELACAAPTVRVYGAQSGIVETILDRLLEVVIRMRVHNPLNAQLQDLRTRHVV